MPLAREYQNEIDKWASKPIIENIIALQERAGNINRAELNTNFTGDDAIEAIRRSIKQSLEADLDLEDDMMPIAQSANYTLLALEHMIQHDRIQLPTNGDFYQRSLRESMKEGAYIREFGDELPPKAAVVPADDNEQQITTSAESIEQESDFKP